MHYYTWNIGDYSSHASHLNPIEDVAYRRLLDKYYLSEAPICSDIAAAARSIGMREYQSEVEVVIREFFTQTESGWVNKRAEQEIAHFKGKIDQASRAGKASAEQRLNARSTPVQRTSNQPITNNQEPVTNKQHKANTSDASRPNPARKKVSLPSDFAVSSRVSAWATEKGFDRLPDHLDAFRRKAEMNAYRYADWDLAFMEAVREDWAKLRGNGRAGPAPVAVPDGTIKCETCGTRTRQFTGRQCDPCWRGIVNPRVAA